MNMCSGPKRPLAFDPSSVLMTTLPRDFKGMAAQITERYGEGAQRISAA